MNYTNLGTSGLRVSRVCLGMMGFGNDSDRPWVIDEDAAEPIVKAAVEGGVTFFDTADAYSGGASEVATGQAGAQVPDPRRSRHRHQGVHAGRRRARTAAASAASTSSRASTRRCKRLKMDYVDLYQIHRWDPRTPIEETMEALHDVVRAGKARYIGASSMFSWQFAKAQHTAEAHGWTKFVSMQNHYNLIYREEEREMIPLCLDQGVGCIPWSPLARGMLAGTRTRDGGRHTTRSSTDAFTDYLYDQPTDFDVVDAVGRGRRGPRRAAGAGRPGLAARQAGGVGADRRLHQEEAPEGRAGGRGAARCPTTRSPRSRSPTCPTRCSGTSRRPVAGGPLGSRRRCRPSNTDRGWHAGRTHGGRLPQPGRAGLRAPDRGGGRASGAGLASGR